MVIHKFNEYRYVNVNKRLVKALIALYTYIHDNFRT